MTDSEPYRLHASLLYQLTLTSRLQERRLEDGLRGLGLTRISWCALVAVENEHLTQPSAIAEFIGIDRTAMSRILRQMEQSDLIARRAGKAPDRRRTEVMLTEAGRTRLCQATPVAEENARYFLSKLPPGGVADLRRLLASLREGETMNLLNL